jgi:hypothetical protein
VLANRDDTFPAEIAVRIAERLAGVDAPAPPARLGERAALAGQPAVTGLWYSPELDTHMVIGAAGDGTVTHVEGGTTYRYTAMSDGSWRGLGCASSIRLRLAGGELWLEEIVGDEPPEVYLRAGDPPAAAPPTGTYYSEELHAHATLAAADGAAPGAETLTIGLASSRTVSPASDGVWAGDGLTVRLLAGDAELEVSLYGARRCRFARIAGAPPPRQRGL